MKEEAIRAVEELDGIDHLLWVIRDGATKFAAKHESAIITSRPEKNRASYDNGKCWSEIKSS